MQSLINRLSKYENDGQEEDVANDQLTIKLIMKTSLDSDITSSLTEDEKLEILLNLKSIHLEFLNIRKIEHMDIFDKTQVLMLQNNYIEVLEGLECMISLEYLNLRDNRIKVVEGLRTLRNLGYLNLGNNLIQKVDPLELPENIEILVLFGNQIDDPKARDRIICRLKYLDEFNGIAVKQEERFKAMGIFPKQLEDYADKMKIRRAQSSKSSRRDILSSSSQKRENHSKHEPTGPDVITQVYVNDTVQKIREKTDQLIEHAQKTQIESLNQNYKELMEYSALHEQIRQDIHKNSLVNKKLENSMTL